MNERKKRQVEERLISLTEENKEQGCDGYATRFLSEKADKCKRVFLETRHHQ